MEILSPTSAFVNSENSSTSNVPNGPRPAGGEHQGTEGAPTEVALTYRPSRGNGFSGSQATEGLVHLDAPGGDGASAVELPRNADRLREDVRKDLASQTPHDAKETYCLDKLIGDFLKRQHLYKSSETEIREIVECVFAEHAKQNRIRKLRLAQGVCLWADDEKPKSARYIRVRVRFLRITAVNDGMPEGNLIWLEVSSSRSRRRGDIKDFAQNLGGLVQSQCG